MLRRSCGVRSCGIAFPSIGDYGLSGGEIAALAVLDAGVRVVATARGLNAQLSLSGYNLQIRIGAHSGFWKLNPAFEGVQHPEISDIVVVAARIEPLAKPGDILLSQQFVDDARRQGYDFEGEVPSPVDDEYVGGERYQAGAGVLISKEREADQRLQIYLVPKASDGKPSSNV